MATLAEIEGELARQRLELAAAESAAALRTSVMTHVAWVPPEWRDAAQEVMRGLAERYPSRTILLVPEPEAEDGLEAEVDVSCFRLAGLERHVCAEIVELRLRGSRAEAPASVVLPLLISDLPAFLRWRGRPPFGAPRFEQLVDVVDRLIVDSREWEGLPGAWAELRPVFERAAVSDIAWSRTLPWRASLARRWPGIASLERLRVEGPAAEAHLLAGWLRDRLGRGPELEHVEAAELESVAVDGEPVAPHRAERPSPADLLSDELDRFERDPIYERAVSAAVG